VEQLTSTRTERPAQDRTTRQAALWATVVAVPLAVLVAVVAFVRLSPDDPPAAPAPSATAATLARSTAPVPVPAPPLAARPATVCRALLSRLPTTLRELPQRPVQAGPEQNAAYGDPPLVVACGIPAPAFPPTDAVFVVNGVCWHSTDRSDAVILAAVDREVPVQVTVPSSYGELLQWAGALAEPIVAAVPSAKTKPSGCTG
jgi:hypothetical protein